MIYNRQTIEYPKGASVSATQERETFSDDDRHYRLKCQICNRSYEDDSFVLECSAAHAPALLVTDATSFPYPLQASSAGHPVEDTKHA